MLVSFRYVRYRSMLEKVAEAVEDYDIESPEIKEIVNYAVFIKDIKTNYSDYSVEDVTPEFKEKVDSLEKTVIELIEAYELDEDEGIAKSLSKYEDVLNVVNDFQTAYTENDTLSEADREYLDIVMLRITGMILKIKGDS